MLFCFGIKSYIQVKNEHNLNFFFLNQVNKFGLVTNGLTSEYLSDNVTAMLYKQATIQQLERAKRAHKHETWAY